LVRIDGTTEAQFPLMGGVPEIAALPSVVYAPYHTCQSGPRPVVRPKLSENRGGTTGATFGVPAKVVVTVAAADMTMVHCVGVPLTGVQVEPKPANVELAPGAVVRVTVLPMSNKELALAHVGPQEMPAGLDVTVPKPVPALDTVSRSFVKVKVVVTVASADIVIVHWDGMPETGVQLEPKLVKFEFVSGLAVRVTVVPWVNWERRLGQVGSQEIAPGFNVTVPVPVPPLDTVSQNCGVIDVKLALTVAAADITMVHWVGAPVTGVQLEPKPANLELASGVAVNVTVVPLSNVGSNMMVIESSKRFSSGSRENSPDR